QIIFYVFSSIAIFSSVLVVASRNPVRSVLSLVLTFFARAGVWLLLQAEFLALILVLVYVGAVMTLFLFVVMMLRVNVVRLRAGFVRYLPWVVLLIGMMIGLMILAVEKFRLPGTPPSEASHFNNIADLGMVLYTDYAYPFEIAAVLLLTAIVAAIGLTHRKSLRRKTQEVSRQMAIRRKDRVTLINVPSEKKIYSSGGEQ
ncbi:MAG: nuoJ, partial [Gammaproteobacteria bacterium]|nr:nuoJ [Gammaproteobacteria bacterium]